MDYLFWFPKEDLEAQPGEESSMEHGWRLKGSEKLARPFVEIITLMPLQTWVWISDLQSSFGVACSSLSAGFSHYSQDLWHGLEANERNRKRGKKEGALLSWEGQELEFVGWCAGCWSRGDVIVTWCAGACLRSGRWYVSSAWVSGVQCRQSQSTEYQKYSENIASVLNM